LECTNQSYKRFFIWNFNNILSIITKTICSKCQNKRTGNGLNGNNKLHYDIFSPDSLLNAINKIVNNKDLLNELRKNVRESVRSFLDTDRLESEYEDVYKKVISRKTF
jgi:glycosyltransferase involved in cell wall biosynthesis